MPKMTDWTSWYNFRTFRKKDIQVDTGDLPDWVQYDWSDCKEPTIGEAKPQISYSCHTKGTWQKDAFTLKELEEGWRGLGNLFLYTCRSHNRKISCIVDPIYDLYKSYIENGKQDLYIGFIYRIYVHLYTCRIYRNGKNVLKLFFKNWSKHFFGESFFKFFFLIFWGQIIKMFWWKKC
jgi:hypothetical protein